MRHSVFSLQTDFHHSTDHYMASLLCDSPSGSKSQRRGISSTSDAKPPCLTFLGQQRALYEYIFHHRKKPALSPLNPPVVLSSAHLCLVRKGEGDRAEDGVFLNALISVTVWAASSLMWNRHFGSVAHAVKKGCDVLMEKQHPPGDLQITGIHLSLRSFVLSSGSPTSRGRLQLSSNSSTGAWSLSSTTWCWYMAIKFSHFCLVLIHLVCIYLCTYLFIYLFNSSIKTWSLFYHY